VPKLEDQDRDAYTIAAEDAPMSAAAETYRSVRSALLFQHAVASAAASVEGTGHENGAAPASAYDEHELEPMIVMVASASPKEGKTTTSANLAAVFAEAGSSVLLVNCDFRRPLLHRYLGIGDIPRQVSTTRVDGVKAVTNVVADTEANPARVVAEQRRLVNAARGKFDVMILDTAPLLSANDAVELVGGVDQVLLVAKAEQSTTNEAERAVEMLERVHAPVAGVILIGTAEAPSYYYRYYKPPEPEARGRRARRQAKAEDAVMSSNGAGDAPVVAPGVAGNGAEPGAPAPIDDPAAH
jgi:Mrp family chromosome partitioning ATPase